MIKLSISSFAHTATVLVCLSALVGISDASADRPDNPGGGKDNARGQVKKNERTITTTEQEANAAPQIDGAPRRSVLEGNFYDFAPNASDPDGDTLRFQITNQPGWTDFDPTTGALYGTPTTADIGNYSDIRISVSDGQLQAQLDPFSVEVSTTATGSVSLQWTPPDENTDGSPLTDLSGYRIYFGDDPAALDNIIQLSNPGLTAYVVENLEPTEWHFAITALNSRGIESSPSNLATRAVN